MALSSDALRKPLSVLALGLAAGLALTGCASSAPEAPSSATTEEAEPEVQSPEEYRAAYEASILRGDALTEHFLIPAGLSDEELAETIISRIEEWENYGSNEQLHAWISNDLFEDSPTLQEKVDDVASMNAAGIKDALFTADWQQKESLVQFGDRMEHNNASTLGFFWQTTIDPEPYRTWAEVASVNSSQLDEQSRQLEVSFVEYANTDKNRSHELGQTSARTPEGRAATMIFTFVSNGEFERISDIS